jgi:hypothetical protein
MNKYISMLGIIVLLLFALSGCTSSGPGYTITISTPSGSTNNASHLGTRAKTSNCQVNGPLQDKACTPGAVFPGVTKQEICQPGYASSVRNVPISEKNQVYAEYGIYHHTTGEYEVDHLISLELGGSNDIANLWPEAASPKPGFHEKDRVENYLHDQVCSGHVSLQQAQYEIANNWLDVYNRMPSYDK